MHLVYIFYALFSLLLTLGLGAYLLKRFSLSTSKTFLFLLLLAAPVVIFVPVSFNLVAMAYHRCSSFVPTSFDKPLSISLAIVLLFFLAVIIFYEMLRLWREKHLESAMPHKTHGTVTLILKELLDLPFFSSCKSTKVRVVPSERPFAFILGIFRPVIYISSWLAENLTQNELKGVLAHELAHLVNKDHYLFPLARLFRQSGFYLPWVDHLWKAFQLEQEMRADHLAAQCLKESGPLASALVKSWEWHLLTRKRGPIGVPAWMDNEVTFVEKRLENLLENKVATFSFSIEFFLGIGLLALIIVSPFVLQIYLFSPLCC